MAVTFVTSTIIKARDQASSVMGRVAAAARRADFATRTLRRNMERLSNVAVRGTAVAAAGATFLTKSSLTAAADFQAGLNGIQARAPDATKAQLEILKQQALDLGATTQFTARQVAEAQEALVARGMRVNDVLIATPKILQLASAEAIELSRAAEIAGTTLTQIGAPVSEIGRVTDVIARVSQLSPLNAELIAASFRDAAPAARSYGVSLERTAATLAVFAKNGIDAAIAGNAFTQGITIFAQPEGIGLKRLEKLGLQMSDFFKIASNGEPVFLGYVNAFEKLNAVGANAFDIGAIFGREFGKRFLPIRNELEQITKIEQQLMAAQGTVATSAAVRLQGLPGVFAEARSAWEAFNIALERSGAFDFLIEALQNVTKWLREISKDDARLKEWVKSFKEIGASVLGVVAGLWALTKLLTAAKTIAALSTLLKISGGGVSGAAKQVAKGVGSAVTGGAAGAVAGGGLSGLATFAALASRAFIPAGLIGLGAQALSSALPTGRDASRTDLARREFKAMQARQDSERTAIRRRFEEEALKARQEDPRISVDVTVSADPGLAAKVKLGAKNALLGVPAGLGPTLVVQP